MADFSTVTTSRGAGAPEGDVPDDSANITNGSACDGALSPSTDGSSPLLGPSVAFSVTF
jgi:hypothetical protein